MIREDMELLVTVENISGTMQSLSIARTSKNPAVYLTDVESGQYTVTVPGAESAYQFQFALTEYHGNILIERIDRTATNIGGNTDYSFSSTNANGLANTFEQKCAIYDDDEAIAGADANAVEAKGTIYTQRPDDNSYALMADRLAGSLTLFTFDVTEKCTITAVYDLAADGRSKLVYVAPDNTVTVLGEVKDNYNEGSEIITLPIGSNTMKLVSDNATVSMNLQVSVNGALEQAAIDK